MQQKSFSNQYSARGSKRRTRNQRKRDAIKNTVLILAAVAIWLAVSNYSLKMWAEHPAEQPITYQQHMESIMGGDC